MKAASAPPPPGDNRQCNHKYFMADASEEELLRELLEYRDERVIVEGVKDERALKSLGFSDVTRLNGGC